MKIKSIIIFFSFLIPIIIISLFLDKSKNLINESTVETDINKIKFCNDISYEKSLLLHPSNFSSNLDLEVKFNSERAWRKELLNGIVQSEINEKDSKGWRNFFSKSKRQKALIIVTVQNNLNCKISAKIRAHGDLMDQRDGSLLPSLNVNLDKGHIFGITKFILFLPKTRNGDNEIFATTLFKELGILSPRSLYLNVKYGNYSPKKFIFQEKIQKELLEQNYLREGPIIEGDERFAFWDPRHKQNLSKNKVVNVNWSKKNEASYEISESSISILNHLVQIHKSEHIKTDNLDYYTVGKKYFNNNYFKNLDIFDSISIAMGSDHPMPRNERRFYFDPLYKEFYPIYFDGMYKILYDEGNDYIDNELLIIPSAKNGAKKSLELIKKVNVNKLQEELSKSGLKLSIDFLDDKLKKIITNLEKILNYNAKNLFKIKVNLKNNSYVKIDDNYDDKMIKRKLVFYSDSFKDYLVCDIYGDNCKKIKFTSKQKKKLINQKLKDDEESHLIFIGKKKMGKTYENWIYQNYFTSDNQVLYMDNNVKLMKIGNPQINIDKDNKKIFITKEEANQRVVFFGGKFDNWSIEMKDLTDIKDVKIYGLDRNNITGCLNFYDTQVKNLDLKFTNSTCEDAINFVRVQGNIKRLEAINSYFDALDSDFSNLLFTNIIIEKSLNDCLDFSFGNYQVLNSKLSKCGDKAISAGEMSNLVVKNINISDSNLGVISKDYARVKISESAIFNVKYCFQAYNKKSEFSGGYLFGEKIKCKFNYKLVDFDNASKIILDDNDYNFTMRKDLPVGKGEYNGI